VLGSLRRVLHATPSLQTDVPFGNERSSGSLVRFPVITTRLMLVAATVLFLSACSPRSRELVGLLSVPTLLPETENRV
jgi:hypothetical protein